MTRDIIEIDFTVKGLNQLSSMGKSLGLLASKGVDVTREIKTMQSHLGNGNALKAFNSGIAEMSNRFDMAYLSIMFGGMYLEKFGKTMLNLVLPAMGRFADFQHKGVKAMTAMNASVEFLKFSLFDAFSQTALFRTMIESVMDLSDWISNIVGKHPTAAAWFAGLAASFVAVGAGLIAIAQGYTGIQALGSLAKILGMGGGGAVAGGAAAGGAATTVGGGAASAGTAGGIGTTIAVATLVITTAYIGAKLLEVTSDYINKKAGNVPGGTTPGGYASNLPGAAMGAGYDLANLDLFEGSVFGDFLKWIFGKKNTKMVVGMQATNTLEPLKTEAQKAGVSINTNLVGAVDLVNKTIGVTDASFTTFSTKVDNYVPEPIVIKYRYEQLGSTPRGISVGSFDVQSSTSSSRYTNSTSPSQNVSMSLSDQVRAAAQNQSRITQPNVFGY